MLFLMTQVSGSGHPPLECVAVQSGQLRFRVSGTVNAAALEV